MKYHFKAGLVSVDPNYPLSRWDRLIHHANITIDFVRSSRIDPKMSAYTHIFGEFSFASTPLEPPGTTIVTHIKPKQQLTLELNGESGCYAGPPINHYRCVQCYFSRTKTVRDCDTVTFFPTTFPFPQVKLDNFSRQAAGDIISILTQIPSTTSPSLKVGDLVHNVILTLSNQLKRMDTIPH